MLPSQGTRSEWSQVFIVAAEVYLFGSCVYILLAQGSEQWWAEGVRPDEKWSLRPRHIGSGKDKSGEMPLLNCDGSQQKDNQETYTDSNNRENQKIY